VLYELRMKSFNFLSLYIIFGFLLILLGFADQINQASTLMLSLCVTVVCLVWVALIRRPVSLWLIDVWMLSYIYLFLSEYILQREEIFLNFGPNITSLTEGFIVAAFGASLVGYSLGVRILFRKQQDIGAEDIDKNNSPEQCHNTVHRFYGNFRRKMQPNSGNLIPGELVLFMIILSAILLFYALRVVTIEQLLYTARSQRSVDLPVSQLDNFLIAIVYTFPIVAAYLWKNYRLPLPIKALFFIVSVLATMITFGLGTRIYLGFQVFGVLFFALEGFQITGKRFLVLAVAALMLTAGQGTIRAARTTGIGNLNWQQMGQTLRKQPVTYLSAEGVLRINALIHTTQTYSPDGRLPENLFILYWWVPRQLWPDKPTLAGYWFIREMTTERGFSSGHSVSGGFAMPALLDFGPTGGVVFCLLYGFGLAGLELYARKNRSREHPGSIITALLYFGVFFMMRSLHTSLIFIMIASLVSALPLGVWRHLTLNKAKSIQKNRQYVRSTYVRRGYLKR
jgi:hypothetical protein